MLRNLRASVHCFGQPMRAVFLRSSLTTTTPSAQGLAPSRFDKPRGTVRYGVIPKRRAYRAKGHMRGFISKPKSLCHASYCLNAGICLKLRSLRFLKTEHREIKRNSVLKTHSLLVYAALYERPGLVAGWQEREQIETNDRMLRN